MGFADQLLADINAVAGVRGSFVCDEAGTVVGEALPPSFQKPTIELASRILLQTVGGLETAKRRRVHQLDMAFRDSRIIVKNLRWGCLYVVCDRNINVPLLDLTANVAAAKLSEMLKELQPEPSGAPPSAEEPEAVPAAEGAPSDQSSLLLSRASQVVDAATRRGVVLRVLGGIAVKAICPSASEITSPSESLDVDLAVYGRERGKLDALMDSMGFEPHQRFNALHGHRRLKYSEPEGGISLDLFVDTFHMCHRLPFADRLELSELSIPTADLLLSKLQIVQMGEKDLRDIYAILCDHDLGPVGDVVEVDSAHVASICADDWGWYKTVTINLEKSVELADDFLSDPQKEAFTSRAHRLRQIIEAVPKSLRWQARARIGEARRWYDLPEE